MLANKRSCTSTVADIFIFSAFFGAGTSKWTASLWLPALWSRSSVHSPQRHCRRSMPGPKEVAQWANETGCLTRSPDLRECRVVRGRGGIQSWPQTSLSLASDPAIWPKKGNAACHALSSIMWLWQDTKKKPRRTLCQQPCWDMGVLRKIPVRRFCHL